MPVKARGVGAPDGEDVIIRPPPSKLDRFVGCLLGHALGDAIGAPFEGLDATTIYYQFGSTRTLLQDPPFPELCYTDDTQMSIGVAEALLEHGRIDEVSLCRAFVANYDPGRGYGSAPANPGVDGNGR